MKNCTHCSNNEIPDYVDYCNRCRGALNEYPDGTRTCPRFGIANLNAFPETRTTVHCNNCFGLRHYKISQVTFEWISNDVGVFRCPEHGRWLAEGSEYEEFLQCERVANSNDGTAESYRSALEKFRRF
tara:strand:+ start:231 stop:614 length:384 start_codon:yes stop_codon:yes gene_type:complete